MKDRISGLQGLSGPHRPRYCLLGIISGAAVISFIYMASSTAELQSFKEPKYIKRNSNDMTGSITSKVLVEINKTQSIRVHFHEKPEWVLPNTFETCEYKCVMTSKPNGFRNAHAEVFHGPRLGSSPPQKIPGHVWVMYGLESPVHYRSNLQNWANLFNWTITYRRDSDIIEPYGLFIQLTDQTSNKSSQTMPWDTKDRIAAWFVSNCGGQSKRQEYAKLLNKSIDLHVYGKCGRYKCSKGEQKKCETMLRKHYKFYLSFENSFCNDYITEKAFKLFSSSLDTIPVMRGQGNYSMYFPPGSYLDTKDFSKASDLAKQMVMIAADKSKFENYFLWKKTASVTRPANWCELCKRLHFAEKYKRLYVDIQTWLEDKPRSACRSPTDLL